MRAHRLGLPTANLNMLSETSIIEQICQIADEEKPQLMVIDSIQVMHMADVIVAGQRGRYAKRRLLTRFAKTRAAWRSSWSATSPKTARWPDQRYWSTVSTAPCCSTATRLVSTCAAIKPLRRGQQLGVFAMTEQGLREVSNPSAIFLSRGDETDR
jgi:DNA repair protein RadA/Sms